ncbi:RagB/SusD family nutrient uptake outer membrane protein [Arenibacter palladensis]|uniref:RagB/SusD family nutrient uptake outer membrane protein n=1 Tax=Arenibacter palladensis TaxID=237373 RepID=UPI0026E1659F|nr:RagB/SusD family nutrient uptake outer membrane protein [Arenibacter palladensis]MDO6605004.1 RagB/SusD family nutrient uptake outer membrane protein [Arenibacter palladensis]
MKRYINRIIIFAITAFAITTLSCEDFLQEEVFTQYDPNAFLQDQSGVDALLTGAYSAMNVTGYFSRDNTFILGEFPTDMTWETGGGLNRLVVPIMQFNWDPTTSFFNGQYGNFYQAIARANNVLLVVNSLSDIDQNTVDKIEAEARFVRSFSYYMLHNLFGPTPIIEIPEGASLDEIEAIGKETPRATEEEYRAYVEADLLFAAEKLSTEGFSSRGNKGSALGLLTKFYLNNKEWQKAADAAQQVLALDYSLYNDYTKLFSVEGENNNEYIFRFECLLGSNQINVYMPHAFPPNYPIQNNWINFGAMFRTYTSFYETFEEQDLRRQLFVTEYVPIGATETVRLDRDAQGNELDDIRSFKYVPDPDAIGQANGNDIPYIRLADIILARAEALNELNGPNQVSIDLINEVRNRAQATPIDLTDFSTKDALRDFILAERGREFFSEGFRREDLIRHGSFIQQAIDRGIAAEAHQVLYPIPQDQIDNNPNLEQNSGY